jgi:hypothetical protein
LISASSKATRTSLVDAAAVVLASELLALIGIECA